MTALTSTFELYVFSHVIEDGLWLNFTPFKDEIRHSGYLLIETITEKNGEIETISYKTHIVGVLGASLVDGMLFNIKESEGVSKNFPNGKFIVPVEDADKYNKFILITSKRKFILVMIIIMM